MKPQDLKYLLSFTPALATYIALTQAGVWAWFTIFYAFGFIPFLELFFAGTPENLTAEAETEKKSRRFFDVLLWLNVPIVYGLLYLFLGQMHNPHLSWMEKLGMLMSMGAILGASGINVAHELGHRSNRWEQFLAKVLLLSSQYMHFFIEHNKGHHKYVATPQDPATARLGESLYAFWVRSVRDSYRSAWKIEAERLAKKSLPTWSFHNQMLQFALVQLAFVVATGFVFGVFAMGMYLLAAIGGALLLETVNYLEHYGLRRKQIAQGVFERVMPHHSWNSNHSLGRILLYELTRHADHHYLASRKYQILRHFDHSPQLPTGYPGMMLLALVPPLWFAVMNTRVSQWEREFA